MKFIRDRIRNILRLNDSPQRLALAFALGVFIAFTPTVGLHIISCLFAAWLFRLSKIVVLTAAFVNNPWTIVPIYGFCLWFGIKITGSTIEVPQIEWNSITLTTAYQLLMPYVWPFVVGTLVVGAAVAVLSYAVLYFAITKYKTNERASPDSQA
jgi:uncharacterized protein (DUF2062 family)